MNDTYDVWEPFAIELLVSTAKTYNGFVTYKQLGEFVQDQTRVRHNGLLTNWIGDFCNGSSSTAMTRRSRISARCASKKTAPLETDTGVCRFRPTSLNR
jgi:hypothetical protein